MRVSAHYRYLAVARWPKAYSYSTSQGVTMGTEPLARIASVLQYSVTPMVSAYGSYATSLDALFLKNVGSATYNVVQG